MERGVPAAPDTAVTVTALIVQRTAQTLGEDAPLHREIFVGIERGAFVRTPADRAMVDQDIAAVTSPERVLVMGRGAHLVAHAETQVTQHDIVRPHGHAEARNADAVAGSALAGDRHVVARNVQPLPEPDDAGNPEQNRPGIFAGHGPAQRSLLLVVVQARHIKHTAAAAARGIHAAALGAGKGRKPRLRRHGRERSGKQQKQKQFFHGFIGFSGSSKRFAPPLTLTDRKTKVRQLIFFSKKFKPDSSFSTLRQGRNRHCNASECRSNCNCHDGADAGAAPENQSRTLRP